MPTPDSSFEKWRGALGDEMMVVAFIDRPLQYCHIVNIGGVAKVPDDLWPEFKAYVTADYKTPSRTIAHDPAAGVVSDNEAELPSAITKFTGDFGDCTAHLGMPITHRRTIKNTNFLEHLLVDECDGSDYPQRLRREDFAQTLVRYHDPHHRALAGHQGEGAGALSTTRRQRGLDHEYETRDGLVVTTSAPTHQANFQYVPDLTGCPRFHRV